MTREKLGTLNAASWLVILGALIVLTEHPQFAIFYATQTLCPEVQEMQIIPHARIHFVMAGVYQHGSPIYRLFGLGEARGFGWEFLYTYMVAWGAALLISYGPIFSDSEEERHDTDDG